jgi:hypothetical protein
VKRVFSDKIVPSAEETACEKYVPSLTNLSIVGVFEEFCVPENLSARKESITKKIMLGCKLDIHNKDYQDEY